MTDTTTSPTMTCQICGRGIKAKSGRIAHHGYTRPQIGWQTRSCPGALELPFQVSRDKLGEHIENVRQQAARCTLDANAIDAGERPAVIYSERQKRRFGYGSMSVDVRVSFTDEADFEARRTDPALSFELRKHSLHTFAEVKAAHVSRLRRETKGLTGYCAEQQARFDSWVVPAAATV